MTQDALLASCCCADEKNDEPDDGDDTGCTDVYVPWKFEMLSQGCTKTYGDFLSGGTPQPCGNTCSQKAPEANQGNYGVANWPTPYCLCAPWDEHCQIFDWGTIFTSGGPIILEPYAGNSQAAFARGIGSIDVSVHERIDPNPPTGGNWCRWNEHIKELAGQSQRIAYEVELVVVANSNGTSDYQVSSQPVGGQNLPYVPPYPSLYGNDVTDCNGAIEYMAFAPPDDQWPNRAYLDFGNSNGTKAFGQTLPNLRVPNNFPPSVGPFGGYKTIPYRSSFTPYWHTSAKCHWPTYFGNIDGPENNGGIYYASISRV